MNIKFKIGDTVQIKSGGPVMTIRSIDKANNQNVAFCIWFINGENQQAKFPVEVLRKYSYGITDGFRARG